MQRLIKTACAIAAEEIGEEKAGRIAEAAQKRYEELLAENADDSKALKAHTFKRIYPSIAVYEAFQAEGVGPEKAAWYIREYFQRFSAKTVPHLQRIIKVFGLARKILSAFCFPISSAAIAQVALISLCIVLFNIPYVRRVLLPLFCSLLSGGSLRVSLLFY